MRDQVLDRAAAGGSHAGSGGIAWFALALWVGAGRRGVRPFAARSVSVGTIAAAHLTSVGLARLIGRARPCHRGRRSIIPCPEGPSLPSDQAASSFAGAVVLGWLDPRLRPLLLAAAASVAAARVRVGVHYPSDVTAGAALGIAVGGLACRALSRRVGDRRSR